MDTPPPVQCPRCHCYTAHIGAAIAGSVVVDILIWCELCDDNMHPYEQATD